jgi:predicted nucleotidyltransferase
MLDSLLLGKTRSAVLREMFLNPDRAVSFNELVRRAKTGDGAVAREVKTLIDAGLIVETRAGNQRLLAARKEAPVYEELKAFILKSSGVPFIVREALRDFEKHILVAFIFGSVAKGRERADSDLDLFVIGTGSYSKLNQQLYAVEDRLGRKVQLLYFDANSEMDRKSLKKGSMKAILAGPKVFLIGDAAKVERMLEPKVSQTR